MAGKEEIVPADPLSEEGLSEDVIKYVLALLEHFFLLISGRQSNGMGSNVISWSDLNAFCKLTGYKYDNFELSLFRELDIIMINEQGKIWQQIS